MNLQLYGDNLTLYGDVLTLYANGFVEATRQPGGFIPRRVILVDKNGVPVTNRKAAEAIVEAAQEATANEPERAAQIMAAVEALPDLSGPVADMLMSDYRAVLAGLQEIDAQLGDLFEASLARMADDDEAVAILLLMA